MTTASDKIDRAQGQRWFAAHGHFLIAAFILAISAGGWSVTVRALKWATVKIPVPWPASVEVDHETFQNVSFPTEIGPFKRAEDGDLSAEPDGTPDGEITIDESVMEPLGIGSYLDKKRVGNRRSNWYVARIYLDTRKKNREEFRAWRFSLFYYTGKNDMVPHVGEECLVAGGATITDSSVWPIGGPDDAPPAWAGQVDLRRTQFAKDGNAYVQYYVFNSNGDPKNDRLRVRLQLALPTMKHCFFAKIELAPLGPVTDVAKTDEATREFLTHFLPAALKALPTSADLERLKAAEKQ